METIKEEKKADLEWLYIKSDYEEYTENENKQERIEELKIKIKEAENEISKCGVNDYWRKYHYDKLTELTDEYNLLCGYNAH